MTLQNWLQNKYSKYLQHKKKNSWVKIHEYSCIINKIRKKSYIKNEKKKMLSRQTLYNQQAVTIAYPITHPILHK